VTENPPVKWSKPAGLPVTSHSYGKTMINPDIKVLRQLFLENCGLSPSKGLDPIKFSNPH
jgi:hypothetical protein